MKIYDVMPEYPTTLEEMQAYDVIILSDVGVNSLQLLPSFRPPTPCPWARTAWTTCAASWRRAAAS